jgi:hypothetical protein
MNPGVFKKEGLKHLDRVIDIVSLNLSVYSNVLTAAIVCQIQHLHRH